MLLGVSLPRRNCVRSIIASSAALLFAAATAVSAHAAPPPDVRHVMILITIAPTSSTNGVRLAVLHFLSERACLAAAEVFAKPVENVTVVARCAPAQ
jgi:hypothetical protein